MSEEKIESIQEDIAALSARWWGDVLREGEIPNVTKQAGWNDLPESFTATAEGKKVQLRQQQAGNIADGLMQMIIKGAEPLKPEEIDEFEKQLARLIVMRGKHGHVSLHVDYHPEGLLVEALEASKIDLAKTKAGARFPLKTNMWIAQESVRVSAGYRAEEEILFTTKRDIIRRQLVEREYPLMDPWRVAENAIVHPLCKKREEIAKKNNLGWSPGQKRHDSDLEYTTAHNAVLAAMEPGDKRREHWCNVRIMLLESLTAMPTGKLEIIVDDLWSALVASDEAYVAERAKEAAAE